MEACENSGYEISDHFGETTEMVQIGSGAHRGFKSYQLSRYACEKSIKQLEKEYRKTPMSKKY